MVQQHVQVGAGAGGAELRIIVQIRCNRDDEVAALLRSELEDLLEGATAGCCIRWSAIDGYVRSSASDEACLLGEVLIMPRIGGTLVGAAEVKGVRRCARGDSGGQLIRDQQR